MPEKVRSERSYLLPEDEVPVRLVPALAVRPLQVVGSRRRLAPPVAVVPHPQGEVEGVLGSPHELLWKDAQNNFGKHILEGCSPLFHS